ncbi:N-acetyltransferase family protein [Streptomyces sp. NA04227]|uniref:GNAT family N-acetyltransferase n=1 Tax=Streptomyces sp. NA04227 TaxID=2742136 RepID=UPI001591023A|nr:GNAT family N-acetyltransferase [Streptomyces sp. NA04227]QKW07153.1 N-acetyltransferase family protein [Streptomyces sp. NA04227]
MPVHSEVQVRAGTEGDLTALTEIYNHYVRETGITFDTRPFTPGERREWLLSHPEDGPHRLLVARAAPSSASNAPYGDACPEAAGGILGYATSSPFRPKPAYATSVEVSIYLAPGSGGRGVGSALYGALFEALRGEGLHRAYAGIARRSQHAAAPAPSSTSASSPSASVPPAPAPAANEPSLRLHRRFGFRHIGTYREVGRKFGVWWDVDWYEKDLADAGPGLRP